MEGLQISDIRHQLAELPLREFYDYWDSLRRGRRMPARRDVDPVRMPQHLPNIMLIDVLHEPRRYRYRLVGSRIVSASAEDRTGQYFEDVAFFKNTPGIIEQYDTVVDGAVPHLSLEPFRNHSNNMIYQAKRLILPLASNAESVDMLMVYFYFMTGPYAKG